MVDTKVNFFGSFIDVSICREAQFPSKINILTPKKYGKFSISTYFRLVFGTAVICSHEWYKTSTKVEIIAVNENNDKYEIFLMFRKRQNGIITHNATAIGM